MVNRDNILQLTEVQATLRKEGMPWIDVVYYNGFKVEWYYVKDKLMNPNKFPIQTSMIKIEGESRIEGKLYWKDELNQKKNQTYYLEEFAILDYSLFDLEEEND